MDAPPHTDSQVQQMRELSEKIGSLEEHHNDVIDVFANTTDNLKSYKNGLHARTDVIEDDLRELRNKIQDTSSKVKRATVILSLLAQKEELSPIENKVNTREYEFFARSDWFKKQLEN